MDARDEAAFVRHQEQNGRVNLFGPSNPLHWRHGYEPVLHRADVRAELGFEKGRFDRAWADHVGADALARTGRFLIETDQYALTSGRQW
jgi:hypothetical protein